MPDYSLCKGDGCLLAFRCRRFTEKPSSQQYYFTDAPYKIVNDALHCDYFWGETQDSIYEQLKDITDAKDNKRGIGKDAIGRTEETKQGT